MKRDWFATLRGSCLDMMVTLTILILVDIRPTWGLVIAFGCFWFALIIIELLVRKIRTWQ